MEAKDILDEKNHVISLQGRITNELADKFLFALDKLASKLVPVTENGRTVEGRLINVVINSYGGPVDASTRISEALSKLTTPDCHVTGIAIRAYSSAFLVLQNCLWRTAIKSNRIVLFHHRMRPAPPNLLPLTAADFRAEQSRYERIAWRSDKPVSEIYKLANQKTALTAKQALAHNFLDYILDTPPPFLRRFFIDIELRMWHLLNRNFQSTIKLPVNENNFLYLINFIYPCNNRLREQQNLQRGKRTAANRINVRRDGYDHPSHGRLTYLSQYCDCNNEGSRGISRLWIFLENSGLFISNKWRHRN